MTQRITSSPGLLAFYKEWQDWAKRGAPHGKPFHRGWGLCRQAGCEREMQKQFVIAGLDYLYPFGREDFTRRAHEETQHLCPKRLAWVAARIADGEEPQT